MDSFGPIIETLKDTKTMFLLSLIMIITGFVDAYFKVGLILSTGIALFAVSTPISLYKLIKRQR